MLVYINHFRRVMAMTHQNETYTGTEHAATATEADIVVGVDGSRESFAALRWALAESVLSEQRVNIVFGWTRSWDLGAEPHDEEDWTRVRASIIKVLNSWVSTECADIPVDRASLVFTPVKASGPEALLEIGHQAQQIVVGRRSLGRVARWFLGSTSASLAEDATVPVTVVRIPADDAEQVEQDMEQAFVDDLPSNVPDADVESMQRHEEHQGQQARKAKSIVVGVDGSRLSMQALEFAAREASLHQATLHVLYCWQLKDLGNIPGYQNAIAPIEVGQQTAEDTLAELVAKARIPDTVTVRTHAFHISPAKGLIHAANHTSWVIVGSRGLSGLDAHFLGSVSKQMLTMTDCTVTIVR
jgi:nucleotide-binding universal stress UspA family protein